MAGENERNSDKNLPRLRFMHQKTHMELPKRELGTPAVGAAHVEGPFIKYFIIIIYMIPNLSQYSSF